MACLGCLLGASGILLTAVKWTTTDTRVDAQSSNGQKAVCALVVYAETQAASIRSSPDLEQLPPERRARSLEAADGLDHLAADMRATGIRCPK